MEFTGTWHIYEMELWDKDYFNMDVQAYIKIEPNNNGFFQFGLVCGEIDGRIVDYADGKRFEFTWEGNEECDPVFDSGWVRIKEMMHSKASLDFIVETVLHFQQGK